MAGKSLGMSRDGNRCSGGGGGGGGGEEIDPSTGKSTILVDMFLIVCLFGWLVGSF